jgi:glycosyltransferase involved in cell wall biosynthesis
MRIAVDARELAGRPTGVGRYLGELLTRWSVLPDALRHQWQLFAPSAVTVPAEFDPGLTVLPGSGGTRWEQWTLPRALAGSRADVLFAPGYSAPLTAPLPTTLTIHDVSFAAHPEWFSAREGTRRRWLTAWSARRAKVVLTDSRFSRDEIVRHIGIPAAKVRVIPLGTSPRRKPRTAANTPAREPIILFVGSIFRRRNLDRLIAAFVNGVASAVPASRLEIVGENRVYPAVDVADLLRQTDPSIASRVGIRSYVSEEVLRDLYSRASVFAFLSEYEGFGLTPLEALAEGVPSLVLDTPVAREVYGPAARYVPSASDTTAVAAALTELLTSDDARGRLLMHAEEVLGRYDWRVAALATLGAIQEAAGA